MRAVSRRRVASFFLAGGRQLVAAVQFVFPSSVVKGSPPRSVRREAAAILVARLVGSGVRLIRPPPWPLVAPLSLFRLPWTMVHGKAVRLLHEAQAHNL